MEVFGDFEADTEFAVWIRRWLDIRDGTGGSARDPHDGARLEACDRRGWTLQVVRDRRTKIRETHKEELPPGMDRRRCNPGALWF